MDPDIDYATYRDNEYILAPVLKKAGLSHIPVSEFQNLLHRYQDHRVVSPVDSTPASSAAGSNHMILDDDDIDDLTTQAFEDQTDEDIDEMTEEDMLKEIQQRFKVSRSYIYHVH